MTNRIELRVEEQTKKRWQSICRKKKITMSSFIKNSVENRLQQNDKREIVKFIREQSNIFAKIENNINQFSRIANQKRFVDRKDMKVFIEFLEELKVLKGQQNEMFAEIINLLKN